MAHDYAGNYYWAVRAAFDGSGIPRVVYRDPGAGLVDVIIGMDDFPPDQDGFLPRLHISIQKHV